MSCDNDDDNSNVSQKSNHSDDLCTSKAMSMDLKTDTLQLRLNHFLLGSDEESKVKTSAAINSVHAALAALQAGQMSLSQVNQ